MISVITATFNCEKFILRAYESLRLQTFSDWEWVIVDDASTDRSQEVLGSISADSRVRMLRNSKNCGRGASRRRAIAEARGDYIAILDMDDFFFSRRLEVANRAWQAGYVFQCSRLVTVDSALTALSIRPASAGGGIRSFPHGTLACRRELARRIGYSDSVRGQDQRIVICLANSFEGHYCDEVLYGYVQHQALSVANAVRGHFSQAAEVSRAVWRGVIVPSPAAVAEVGYSLAKGAMLSLYSAWDTDAADRFLYDRRLRRENLVVPAELEFELRRLAQL